MILLASIGNGQPDRSISENRFSDLLNLTRFPLNLSRATNELSVYNSRNSAAEPFRRLSFLHEKIKLLSRVFSVG